MLPARCDLGRFLLDRELVMPGFSEGCERLVRSGFAVVNRKRRGRGARAGRPGPRQAGCRTATQEPAARPTWLHLRSITSCPQAACRGSGYNSDEPVTPLLLLALLASGEVERLTKLVAQSGQVIEIAVPPS